MSGYIAERYTMEVVVIDKEVSAGVSVAQEKGSRGISATGCVTGAERALQNTTATRRRRFATNTVFSDIRTDKNSMNGSRVRVSLDAIRFLLNVSISRKIRS